MTSKTSPSTVALIPAYNEESTIREVIEEASGYVDEVIVIDDKSTDRTRQEAIDSGAELICHEENRGVGAALYSGYQVALERNFDIIIQLDSDGQHDPAYIPDFIEEINNGTDIVIGSRWLNESHEQYSIIRRLGIQFFTIETNLLTGQQITDVTSGYRAYRREVIESLQQPSDKHWALEQTIHCGRRGYSIEDISIPMPPEPEGSQFDLITFALYPFRMGIVTLKALIPH